MYKVSGFCETCDQVVIRLDSDQPFNYLRCPNCRNLVEMEE